MTTKLELVRGGNCFLANTGICISSMEEHFSRMDFSNLFTQLFFSAVQDWRAGLSSI